MRAPARQPVSLVFCSAFTSGEKDWIINEAEKVKGLPVWQCHVEVMCMHMYYIVWCINIRIINISNIRARITVTETLISFDGWIKTVWLCLPVCLPSALPLPPYRCSMHNQTEFLFRKVQVTIQWLFNYRFHKRHNNLPTEYFINIIEICDGSKKDAQTWMGWRGKGQTHHTMNSHSFFFVLLVFFSFSLLCFVRSEPKIPHNCFDVWHKNSLEIILSHHQTIVLFEHIAAHTNATQSPKQSLLKICMQLA